MMCPNPRKHVPAAYGTISIVRRAPTGSTWWNAWQMSSGIMTSPTTWGLAPSGATLHALRQKPAGCHHLPTKWGWAFGSRSTCLLWRRFTIVSTILYELLTGSCFRNCSVVRCRFE